MATINPVWNAVGHGFVIAWANMRNGDTGAPIADDPRDADGRTIQVSGNFAGGSVQIEGSVDGNE